MTALSGVPLRRDHRTQLDQPPRLPTFFLLGAARCGSTSLAAMLGEHPTIFMTKPKEPSFFSGPSQVIAHPLDYVALFEETGDATAIGEASHAYLSHPAVAQTLAAFFPDAKFVLTLRNPVDRAFSLYQWAARSGVEWAPNFEAALRLEPMRAKRLGSSVRGGSLSWNHLYVASGLFGKQVQRYRRFYDADRFLFVTLDETTADPLGTLNRIFRFLDVAETETVAPRHLNLSTATRLPTIEWARQRAMKAARLPQASRAPVGTDQRNRSDAKAMSKRTRAKLVEQYRDDMTLFESMSGIDLLQD